MKISISYPPIPQVEGTPLISQNRQYQVFSAPTYIYPMVPAFAATLLLNEGYDVLWDDAISEEKSYSRWLNDLGCTNPDVMKIETKTPVVKKHWRMIEDIKETIPETQVALVGDHVTALPYETMKNSRVDFVLTGGDYDFLLLNLIKFLEEKEKLEPGIWYRDNGEIKNTGPFRLNHSLDSLPFIDRELTKWWLYSEKNGNFKQTPGTYTMVGRDCWWRKEGGCTFCSWPTLYPTYRTRKPQLLVEEIGTLIEQYGVKEVFDDTGTFPIGKWLKEFTTLMVKSGYNEKIRFGCNMRFGALGRESYRLLRKAGFRMLLFGLESASQKTLNRLNKGVIVEDIVRECKMASEEGLEPHITIMVGYPWETKKDALATLELARKLMVKGWAVTLQSTIVMPYPGSKLYGEALKNDWFGIDPTDYDKFDMKGPVLKTPDMSPEEIKEICDGIYKVFLSPRYVLKQLTRIRSLKDLRYSAKGLTKVLGHVKDFEK